MSDDFLILGIDQNLARGIFNGKFGGDEKDIYEFLQLEYFNASPPKIFVRNSKRERRNAKNASNIWSDPTLYLPRPGGVVTGESGNRPPK